MQSLKIELVYIHSIGLLGHVKYDRNIFFSQHVGVLYSCCDLTDLTSDIL